MTKLAQMPKWHFTKLDVERQVEMLRLCSLVISAGVAALALGEAVAAASDITVAAIATGRLYVLGTTEHPHVSVILDDKFRTESDDQGKFQYELVYYPARCIVSASIEGVTYEAVVGNCGQQMLPGTWLEPRAAVDTPALLERLTSAKAELESAALCRAISLGQTQPAITANPTNPAPPIFTAAAWANLFAPGELASMRLSDSSETGMPAAISQDNSRPDLTIEAQPKAQIPASSTQ
jgi:hypothetical protein